MPESGSAPAPVWVLSVAEDPRGLDGVNMAVTVQRNVGELSGANSPKTYAFRCGSTATSLQLLLDHRSYVICGADGQAFVGKNR